MVDIFIELPDAIKEAYERKAAALGRTAEELMRDAIERHAIRSPSENLADLGPLTDEPVVKAAEIEKEYRRLGYTRGWRFVTCPWKYGGSAKLLLVSLNPAGQTRHGPAWSQEEGSSYRIESWNSSPLGTAPLQRQVQQLFDFLKLDDSEVFSAHYIPFRSPSWSELDRKEEAERYVKQLWGWLLPKVRFERVVCIGKDRPGKPIAELLGAKFEVSLPVGWGAITADRYRLADGRPVIALPHLSRFAIFGREVGNASLAKLFDV